MSRYIFIATAAICLFCSCTDGHKSIDALHRADSLMHVHPDSALYILKNINPASLRGRSNKAHFALLYAQALDKNCIDVDRDTLTSRALKYYRHRGNAQDRALAYYYSGRVYENAGNIDSAIVLINLAEQSAIKTDDNYLKGLIANVQAGLYASQRYLDLAQQKYLEAADFYAKAGHKENQLRSYIGALSSMPLDRQYAGLPHYLIQAEQLAIDTDNRSALLYLARYKAHIQKNIGDYAGALETLQNGIVEYADGRIPKSYYSLLSNIYIKRQQPDSAYRYLEPLLSNSEADPRERIEYCYLQSRICELKGQYEQALILCNRALSISDSLYFVEKEHAVPELKAKYRNEQLLIHNKYLRQISKYRAVAYTVALILIVFVFLWRLNVRQKKILRQKQEIEEYLNTISRLKGEYEILQTQQNDLPDSDRASSIDTKILTRHIDFLKQILDIATNFGHDKEKFHEKIEGLLTKSGHEQNKKEQNEIFLIFQDLLDSRQPGIVAYIGSRYPLSEQELTLYCMICLDISKSAICLVLASKSKTYYNYRNLLRNKLSITNEEMTIRQHFERMCSEYRASMKR